MSALIWLSICTGLMAAAILVCDFAVRAIDRFAKWFRRERIIAQNSYVATQREVRRLQARRRMSYPDRRFRTTNHD